MIEETPSATSSQTPPPVLKWFKIYTGVMTGVYVLCTLAAPIMFWIGMRTQSEKRVVLMIQGAILFAVGAVFAVAFVVPFFLTRKPWVWAYNLVLICIGMTSCCILPASVVLLVYWIKPDVKLWFNRT